MNTKNLIVICIAFYITTMTIGLVFWPTVYRYDSMTFRRHSVAVRINRMTGGVTVCDVKTGAWVSIGEIELEEETPKRRYGRAFGR